MKSEASAGTLISQKANYAGDFGEVLRSSGIFYFVKHRDFKTTISFMNYWKVRQNLDILPLATIRDMKGKLLGREKLNFDAGSVINFSPDVGEDFEGSVEIEIFSLKNLRIPYAALMAVYESPCGISMVHNYARCYSQHEIEEGRTISKGHEACIPVVGGGNASVVLHNGGDWHEEQIARLKVVYADKRTVSQAVPMPKLRPFETVRLNITRLLERPPQQGEMAEAYLSFNVKNAFSRVLCINESADGSEFQVTHSDFNYSIHRTDSIHPGHAIVPMPQRIEGAGEPRLIVWGANARGEYTARNSQAGRAFDGESFEVIDSPFNDKFLFGSEGGRELPSRIHTAIRLGPGLGERAQLPSICNLGIFHRERPPKRMWWAVVADKDDARTSIVVNFLEELYGPHGNQAVHFRLYSASGAGFLSREIGCGELANASEALPFTAIFPECRTFLGGSFGYITAFSEYPGLLLYTCIINRNGSVTIEHGF